MVDFDSLPIDVDFKYLFAAFIYFQITLKLNGDEVSLSSIAAKLYGFAYSAHVEISSATTSDARITMKIISLYSTRMI